MSELSGRILMSRLYMLCRAPWLQQFSTFEKVIVANSAIIILDTAAGWWITQHNPETYHYLIDTSFIALAALLGVAVNFALLRAAFAPLHSVLATIRAVEQGNLDARVESWTTDADALALARTFNAMLDRLALARDEAAARVLRAQETERRRLALELHDQTGQSLTALALHAEVIAQWLRTADQTPAVAQARQQAERLGALAQRTLVEVQVLSRQLRPPLLDDLGLPAALHWLAEDAGERLRVAVHVRVRGLGHDDARSRPPRKRDDATTVAELPAAHAERLPEGVETALFRIAQESLTNAVRHGHARQIALALRWTAAQVSLSVADDGRGFVPGARLAGQRGQTGPGGMGLEGMFDRARLLGGTLALRSLPRHGCVVRVVIPLPLRRPAVARVSAVGQSTGATATRHSPAPGVLADTWTAGGAEALPDEVQP
jgi:two-component system sensor histidine kinase UhpB